jgi:hypothetical protein
MGMSQPVSIVPSYSMEKQTIRLRVEKMEASCYRSQAVGTASHCLYHYLIF